jgi:hypothetical protein
MRIFDESWLGQAMPNDFRSYEQLSGEEKLRTPHMQKMLGDEYIRQNGTEPPRDSQQLIDWFRSNQWIRNNAILHWQNLVGKGGDSLVSDYMAMGNKTPEEVARDRELYNAYGEMDWFWQEHGQGFMPALVDFAKMILVDPTSVLGVGWAAKGAIQGTKGAATAAVKAAFRQHVGGPVPDSVINQALAEARRTAVRQETKRGFGRGALESGGISGGIEGTVDALTQAKEMELGVRDQYSPGQTAASVGVGAAFGGLVGGGMGALSGRAAAGRAFDNEAAKLMAPARAPQQSSGGHPLLHRNDAQPQTDPRTGLVARINERRGREIAESDAAAAASRTADEEARRASGLETARAGMTPPPATNLLPAPGQAVMTPEEIAAAVPIREKRNSQLQETIDLLRGDLHDPSMTPDEITSRQQQIGSLRQFQSRLSVLDATLKGRIATLTRTRDSAQQRGDLAKAAQAEYELAELADMQGILDSDASAYEIMQLFRRLGQQEETSVTNEAIPDPVVQADGTVAEADPVVPGRAEEPDQVPGQADQVDQAALNETLPETPEGTNVPVPETPAPEPAPVPTPEPTPVPRAARARGKQKVTNPLDAYEPEVVAEARNVMGSYADDPAGRSAILEAIRQIDPKAADDLEGAIGVLSARSERIASLQRIATEGGMRGISDDPPLAAEAGRRSVTADILKGIEGADELPGMAKVALADYARNAEKTLRARIAETNMKVDDDEIVEALTGSINQFRQRLLDERADKAELRKERGQIGKQGDVRIAGRPSEGQAISDNGRQVTGRNQITQPDGTVRLGGIQDILRSTGKYGISGFVRRKYNDLDQAISEALTLGRKYGFIETTAPRALKGVDGPIAKGERFFVDLSTVQQKGGGLKSRNDWGRYKDVKNAPSTKTLGYTKKELADLQRRLAAEDKMEVELKARDSARAVPEGPEVDTGPRIDDPSDDVMRLVALRERFPDVKDHEKLLNDMRRLVGEEKLDELLMSDPPSVARTAEVPSDPVPSTGEASAPKPPRDTEKDRVARKRALSPEQTDQAVAIALMERGVPTNRRPAYRSKSTGQIRAVSDAHLRRGDPDSKVTGKNPEDWEYGTVDRWTPNRRDHADFVSQQEFLRGSFREGEGDQSTMPFSAGNRLVPTFEDIANQPLKIEGLKFHKSLFGDEEPTVSTAQRAMAQILNTRLSDRSVKFSDLVADYKILARATPEFRRPVATRREAINNLRDIYGKHDPRSLAFIESIVRDLAGDPNAAPIIGDRTGNLTAPGRFSPTDWMTRNAKRSGGEWNHVELNPEAKGFDTNGVVALHEIAHWAFENIFTPTERVKYLDLIQENYMRADGSINFQKLHGHMKQAGAATDSHQTYASQNIAETFPQFVVGHVMNRDKSFGRESMFDSALQRGAAEASLTTKVKEKLAELLKPILDLITTLRHGKAPPEFEPLIAKLFSEPEYRQRMAFPVLGEDQLDRLIKDPRNKKRGESLKRMYGNFTEIDNMRINLERALASQDMETIGNLLHRRRDTEELGGRNVKVGDPNSAAQILLKISSNRAVAPYNRVVARMVGEQLIQLAGGKNTKKGTKFTETDFYKEMRDEVIKATNEAEGTAFDARTAADMARLNTDSERFSTVSLDDAAEVLEVTGLTTNFDQANAGPNRFQMESWLGYFATEAIETMHVAMHDLQRHSWNLISAAPNMKVSLYNPPRALVDTDVVTKVVEAEKVKTKAAVDKAVSDAKVTPAKPGGGARALSDQQLLTAIKTGNRDQGLAAAKEIERRQKALISQDEIDGYDYTPELEDMSPASLRMAFRDAIIEADDSTANAIRAIWQSRGLDEMVAPETSRVKKSLFREHDSRVGDDAIPTLGPTQIKNMLRGQRDRRPDVQNAERTLLNRMLNLVSARAREDGLASVDVVSIDEFVTTGAFYRALGRDVPVDADANAIFVNFPSKDFSDLKRKFKHLATGVIGVRENADAMDVMHETMHALVSAKLWTDAEMQSIKRLFKAADDPLAQRVREKYGNQSTARQAEEWLVEGAAQYLAGKVKRGNIGEAAQRTGGVAELADKGVIEKIFDEIVEYVSYLFNGLMGRPDMRKMYRRVLDYGDMSRPMREAGDPLVPPHRVESVSEFVGDGIGQTGGKPTPFIVPSTGGRITAVDGPRGRGVYLRSEMDNDGLTSLWPTREVIADRIDELRTKNPRKAAVAAREAEQYVVRLNSLKDERAARVSSLAQNDDMLASRSAIVDADDLRARVRADRAKIAEIDADAAVVRESLLDKLDVTERPTQTFASIRNPLDATATHENGIAASHGLGRVFDLIEDVSQGRLARDAVLDAYGDDPTLGRLLGDLLEGRMGEFDAQAFRQRLAELGHDGIKDTIDGKPVLVAFDPDQVRLIDDARFDDPVELAYYAPAQTNASGQAFQTLMEGMPIDRGKFELALELRGETPDSIEIKSSLFRKPSKETAEGVVKFGLMNWFKLGSKGLRDMNVHYMADALKPVNGPGFYEKHTRFVGETLTSAHTAMFKLPDAQGVWKSIGSGNPLMAQYKFRTPPSHKKIAQAMRYGRDSAQFDALTRDEQGVFDAVARFFDQAYERGAAMGLNHGYIKGYIPQLRNANIVAKKRDKHIDWTIRYFKAEAEHLGVPARSDSELLRSAQTVTDNIINNDGVYIPDAMRSHSSKDDFERTRMIQLHLRDNKGNLVYKDLLDEAHSEGFLVDDLAMLTTTYADKMARQALLTERFGKGFHGYGEYKTVAAKGLHGAHQLLSTDKVLRYDHMHLNDVGQMDKTTTEQLALQMFSDNVAQEITKELETILGNTNLSRAQKKDAMATAIRTRRTWEGGEDFLDKRIEAIASGLLDHGKTGGKQVAMNVADHYFAVMRGVSPTRGAGMESLAPISSGLKAFSNVTMLSMTTVASLSDPMFILARSGSMRSFLKGITALRDPEYKEMIKSTGVAMEQIIQEQLAARHGVTNADGPIARKLQNDFFTGIGLSDWTKITRLIAGSVAYQTFKAEIARAARYGEGTRPWRQANRFLREYGLEHLLDRNGPAFDDVANTREVQEAIIQFANGSVFLPNANDMPLLSHNPIGSLIWQLKSFPLQYGRLFNHSIKQAASGGAEDEARRLAPIVYLMSAGVGMGAGVLAIRDYLQGRGGEDGTSRALRKRALTDMLPDSLQWVAEAAESVDIGPTDLNQVAGWYLEGFGQLGGLSLLSQLIHEAIMQADDGVYGAMQMTKFLAGPTFGFGVDLYSNVVPGLFDTLTGAESNAAQRRGVRTVASRMPVLGQQRGFREGVTDMIAGPVQEKKASSSRSPARGSGLSSGLGGGLGGGLSQRL